MGLIIGSRDADKAKAAASKIQTTIGSSSRVYGLVNPEVASKADILVVTVPFAALPDTIKSLKSSIKPGQIVVNVTVPLETAVGGLVCGDDTDAKKVVLDLAKAIPGVRGVDAGPLSNSRTIEQLTALLVSLNIRYGVKTAGLRITGLHSST